ncbi:alpha/beta hydrolase [Acinetobacter sp.]|uniref:alpha/beta hydrolase n=1 Tax=Acinetobacter sp. TaxID=472 RepID=UPI0035AE9E16
MNIVFIHGMNQQRQTARSLEKRWLNLLEQSLKNIHQHCHFPYLKQHFRMPFYGDLLSRHHLENTLSASTLMPQTWIHLPFIHPAKPEEHQPAANPLPEMQMNDSHSFQHELHTLGALSKDYALRDFALLMNYFPKLHATLLHKFLVETYLYLSNPHFMHEVHVRIHEQLHSTKPNVIVAHSLGSVIAYHFLLLHPELNVPCFITLGSPLAFRVIQGHLPQPIQRPAVISGDWINFYSHDDFLTAFPLQNAPFDFSPAIINHQIRTSIDRPHDIDGYLKHPDVIQAIVDTFKNST